MRKLLIHLVLSLIVSAALTSCATASFSKYKGIGRIKTYHISSKDVPPCFDGFRIAFATDFHYESRFGRKRLPSLVKALASLDADVLLLGGDYRGRNGGDVGELFDAISGVKMPYGIYAVMGNHERGENDSLVRKAMDKTGVVLLEHKVDTIARDCGRIMICGIRNPFDLEHNGVSPTLYGGQVSLFNKWSPAKFSKYGNRFLTGKKTNTAGIPVIISNGLGTSRKDIRLFTPSEIILVILESCD